MKITVKAKDAAVNQAQLSLIETRRKALHEACKVLKRQPFGAMVYGEALEAIMQLDSKLAMEWNELA